MWYSISSTPFNKGNYRELNIDVVIYNDYAYFLNGSDGNSFNDFWRMNLNTYQWERLSNNPLPKKYSSSFILNNELYSVSEEIIKYNFSTGFWEQIDKPGITFGMDMPINSFIQNDIPYVIKHEMFSSATYLNLFKGDLLY